MSNSSDIQGMKSDKEKSPMNKTALKKVAGVASLAVAGAILTTASSATPLSAASTPTAQAAVAQSALTQSDTPSQNSKDKHSQRERRAVVKSENIALPRHSGKGRKSAIVGNLNAMSVSKLNHLFAEKRADVFELNEAREGIVEGRANIAKQRERVIDQLAKDEAALKAAVADKDMPVEDKKAAVGVATAAVKSDKETIAALNEGLNFGLPNLVDLGDKMVEANNDVIAIANYMANRKSAERSAQSWLTVEVASLPNASVGEDAVAQAIVSKDGVPVEGASVAITQGVGTDKSTVTGVSDAAGRVTFNVDTSKEIMNKVDVEATVQNVTTTANTAIKIYKDGE